MKSPAADVGEYVAHIAEPWRSVVERLRATCRDRLDGYDEVMAYGMPTYQLVGQVEVAFAKQAKYLSLYVMKKAVLDAHRSELRGLDVGKGCIRYRRPEQIDWVLVGHLLSETALSAAPPC